MFMDVSVQLLLTVPCKKSSNTYPAALLLCAKVMVSDCKMRNISHHKAATQKLHTIHKINVCSNRTVYFSMISLNINNNYH